MWCRIVGDRLIGAYVLPQRVNGQTYLEFLQNVMPDLLDDVPYRDGSDMRFMDDGAPSHFSILVLEYSYLILIDE